MRRDIEFAVELDTLVVGDLAYNRIHINLASSGPDE